MSGDHNQYQKPKPFPAKSKGALSHEENKQHNKKTLDKFYEENAHFYAAPPQREWQGLTTQEIADETDIATSSNKDIFDLRKAFWCGARWAEAKLKEKNT